MAELDNKDNLTRPTISSENSGDFRSRISSVAHDLNQRYNLSDRFQGVVTRAKEDRKFMYLGLGVLGVGLGFGAWALYRYFSEEHDEDLVVSDQTYTV